MVSWVEGGLLVSDLMLEVCWQWRSTGGVHLRNAAGAGCVHVQVMDDCIVLMHGGLVQDTLLV